VHVVVIGATGYVGARLVPRLLAAGHTVRCLVRCPERLRLLPWAPHVELSRGDVRDRAAARRAAVGMDAAVHLVHSMDAPGFAERDRQAAHALTAATEAAGTPRVVYLSGLQPADVGGSPHLASRREVGEILLAGSAPAAVLQAGVVVGAGSTSFELIRHTAESAARLPVAVLPDRAWNRVQPIGVDDLLHLLVSAVGLPPEVNRTFDVGGPDVLTYWQLAAGYIQAAGLRRPIALPVPIAAPRLTARALAALTPFDRHLTGPLLASTAHDLVCREDDLAALVGPPPGGRTPYAEAVARALRDDGAAGPAQGNRPARPADRRWRIGAGGSALG
jgi:uncharacterized protein YbjT (DUF2867 family)